MSTLEPSGSASTCVGIGIWLKLWRLPAVHDRNCHSKRKLAGQATDVRLLQGGSVVQRHMVAVHMRMLRRRSCQQLLLAGGCEEQR